MPGRKYTAANAYRYGFNGKENDNDVKGEGNQQDYGMRIYDPRLGRFLSVDPIAKSYPWNTPYSFAENDVIRNLDLDGLERIIYLIEKVGAKIYINQLTLAKAGPLGNGVAARYINGNGDIHYFYGTEVGTAIDFAKSYEGNGIPRHPFERYDDSRGYATIGYGHLMSADDKKRYPITASDNPHVTGSKMEQQVAEDLFTNDYNGKVAQTIESLAPRQFEGGKLEAFTDFSFNIKNARERIGTFTEDQGGTFFLGFMGGGPGLEKRRIAEMLMFDDGSHIMFQYLKPNSRDEKKLKKTIIENTPFSGGGDESKNLNNSTVS